MCAGVLEACAVLSVLPLALCWASSDEDIVLGNCDHTANGIDIGVRRHH